MIRLKRLAYVFSDLHSTSLPLILQSFNADILAHCKRETLQLYIK